MVEDDVVGPEYIKDTNLKDVDDVGFRSSINLYILSVDNQSQLPSGDFRCSTTPENSKD